MSSSSAAEWLQPSTKPKDTSDHFPWAKQNQVFLEAVELKEHLLAGGTDVLVLDTRDDDAAGGHVHGALHWPDSTFDARVDELLALLRTGTYSRVVLHCMESIRRGPRCCRKLRNMLAAERARDAQSSHLLPAPSAVMVLMGGADQWLRAHWSNRALVDAFDDDYWGFASDACERCDDAALPSDASRAADASHLHALYQRPDDQAFECVLSFVDCGDSRHI
jgi:hypothetical protein